jgi:hypothetical protein
MSDYLKRVSGPVVEGLERLTFNQQITVQVRAGLPPRDPEDDNGPSEEEIEDEEIERLDDIEEDDDETITFDADQRTK